MIYAKIHFDEKNKYKLKFTGSAGIEERSAWANYLENLKESLKENESLEEVIFDEKGELISEEKVWKYLAKNNFIPVSENFFYKK